MPASQTDRIGGLTTSVAVKAPVRVATTGTPITLYGIQQIDGVTLQAGNGMDILADRVLVKDQADPVENGIYKVSARAWTRSDDFNGAFDAVEGTLVYVLEGNAWNDTYFRVTTPSPIEFNISDITFEPALGNLQLPEHIEDPVDIYLVDDGEYREARTTDAGPRIQAIIDSYPNSNSTSLNIYFPSGDTYMSDVGTGQRRIAFIGKGRFYTNIIPTTITNGTFNLDGPAPKVIGMAINDIANSFGLPGFTLPTGTFNSVGRWVPNDLRALIRIGRGGNETPRAGVLEDIAFQSSRAIGLNYEGGSVLLIESCVWGQCAGGGWYIPNSNGDTNHWKIRNSTFTGCFGFNCDLGGGVTNSGGAGTFEDLKLYGGENYNMYIGGDANSGSVFTELANSYRQLMSTTIGLTTAVLPREQMASISVGQVFNNNAYMPNGTYVTSVNKNAGTIELSTAATATTPGSITFTSFTQTGMRNPSVWLGSTAAGNLIHIMGDNLDPVCFRDDSTAGSNTLVTYNGSTVQYIYDNNSFKQRVTTSERQTGNPNVAMSFATMATFNGTNTFTLSDPTVANRIRYGATVTSGAYAANTSVTAVDPVLGTVTTAAVATGSGPFYVSFRPNQRGGLLAKCFDDNQVIESVGGTNVSQTKAYLGRGSRYIGTTVGTTTLLIQRFDDDFEAPANGKALWCYDPTIIPDGTTIVSFTGPDANGIYTVVMSQAALLARTGVTMWLYNTSANQSREVHPHISVSNSNATAVASNLRLGEYYRTPSGELRAVVAAANSLAGTLAWDPASIAVGASELSPDATITGAAVGDFVDVASGRDLLGLQLSGYVSVANTVKLTLYNNTAGAVNLGNTSFNIRVRKA